ncbi:hypothetical protein PACILC2_07000 [Paenibacillus cisolokensis]|uniref:Ketopantoate hydroxymethyltransferase n=1 Tax=Paenibacillus cisolokensis TaxID=1658519 RepID=A0ABQ4N1S6_9BACL|nr:ketopantoate hydroxymethyltransferase [Paenibacillus cisolokensis]GIQ62132.1 hypothetical protein PACILC2_07000 [Paenibacillus cisolokensis]
MIAEHLLHDLAEYVGGRVAKVVLNGNYEIAEFEVKQVTDNVLALNYLVPVSDVPLITLIELKDSANKVLSSHEVNVPIASDTMMLQTVEVKEV